MLTIITTLLCVAIGRLPDKTQLRHVQEFRLNQIPADSNRPPPINNPSALMNKPTAPMLLSFGLPPVPARLMKRIQDGLFIEMPDLLPEKLISAECNVGDNAAGQKQKHQEMITILKWVQCFGLYTAIVSHAKLERTADLLGYQHLIINASQHCREGQQMS